jgi:hypothetical protein
MHHTGVDVIGVLMRDEQGVRAGGRISSAPDTGVDHDLLAVTFKPDARVPELRHPHLPLLSACRTL